jgi:(p)ppGpp synthase/HD superfamily hydrolase
MNKLESAQLFAKGKHSGIMQADGITPYWKHLESVVSRLKNIGINDEDILCAAWLHDVMDYTNVTFDDIYQRFGQNVAVMVLSISKDKKLHKKDRETQYMQQLKNASWQAQLIKLCDISSDLKNLQNLGWSKTKKSKQVKKMLHYVNAIKSGIVQNKSEIPSIESIVNGINDVLKQYGHKPVLV